MTALESLRKRAPMFAMGLVSFLAVLAVMRWSAGDPLIQPSGDVGIVIGAALVALFFVLNDTRGGGNAPASKPGRNAPARRS